MALTLRHRGTERMDGNLLLSASVRDTCSVAPLAGLLNANAHDVYGNIGGVAQVT